MSHIGRRPLLLGAAAVWASPAFAQSDALQGEWHGVLAAGAARLRLRLVIDGDSATLYSLDQGNAAIPVSAMRIDGARIHLTLPAVNGEYEGRLEEGRIVGHWSQGQALPLTFERGPAPQAQAPAPIQPLTQARLAALRAEVGAPALAAAAAHRDGRALTLADGVRAVGRSEAVTTRDIWHLGSITKSMTATLVARCVEAGLVSWDDTLGAVLGAAAPEMRADYRDCSFLHLMSHRAGLQANIDLADFARFPRESADARADRLAYARLALAQAPAGPKETSFLYSNSGFVLAGAMLEAKLGATWESLVRERVFAPLGMTSAGFGAPGRPGAYDQPVGHADVGGGTLGAFPPGGPVTDNPAVLGPAGRVHASFEDMLKYLAAHRDRSALLRAESWERLHTPPFGGDYALGWIKQGDALWHNGSNTLWYAEAVFVPARGVAAVAAANDGRMGIVSSTVNIALRSAAKAVE